jgi:hypothetical protein
MTRTVTPPAGKRVRTDLVVDVDNCELCLRLPVESKVEIAREYLPPRAIVQLDHVALGM